MTMVTSHYAACHQRKGTTGQDKGRGQRTDTPSRAASRSPSPCRRMVGFIPAPIDTTSMSVNGSRFVPNALNTASLAAHLQILADTHRHSTLAH